MILFEAKPADIGITTIVIYAVIGFIAGYIISVVMSAIMKVWVARRPNMIFVSKRLRVPQRIFFLVLGTGVALMILSAPRPLQAAPLWRPQAQQAFLIALFLVGAGLVTGLIKAAEDLVVNQRQDGDDSPHFRRIRTQIEMVSRVGIAVVWICAVAGALLTFPQFRTIGASLFASAGLVSIVVGLASQSLLANMFAGMQLAFSDALRVGDVVVIETNMGVVEEITLTYVVVKTWDGRRWIVPSTYFASKSFENWTRHEPKLLGTVEWDLDWMVPIDAMRIKLTQLVNSHELWDGRTCGMQVTDSTNGIVRVRAVVSADNHGDLWDLRCFVREEILRWLQNTAPFALPRTRLEPEPTAAPPLDERQQLLAELEQAWEAEQASSETKVLPQVESDKKPRPAPDKRSWIRTYREQRKAMGTFDDRDLDEAEKHKLLASMPKDDDEDTVEQTSNSAEARLYSGSPEAEERKKQFSGPSKAEMDERAEKSKSRRLAESEDSKTNLADD